MPTEFDTIIDLREIRSAKKDVNKLITILVKYLDLEEAGETELSKLIDGSWLSVPAICEICEAIATQFQIINHGRSLNTEDDLQFTDRIVFRSLTESRSPQIKKYLAGVGYTKLKPFLEFIIQHRLKQYLSVRNNKPDSE